MSRYAVKCSIDQLKKHLMNAAVRHPYNKGNDDGPGDENSEFDPFILTTLSPTVEKDLGKVQFDCENFEFAEDTWRKDSPMNVFLGYHTLPNGFSFLGCYAGGDWESPVWFIFYWSGTEIRAYLPTHGNVYNSKTKMAYGNSDDDEEAPEPDFALMLADIKERIIIKDDPDTAQKAEKDQHTKMTVKLTMSLTATSNDACQKAYIKLIEQIGKMRWVISKESKDLEVIEDV